MSDKSRCAIYPDGSKIWYLDGQYHKTDGPAIEYPDGTQLWYLNGKLHREDGPAVNRADGSKFWYLHGTYFDPIVHFLKVGELELDKS